MNFLAVKNFPFQTFFAVICWWQLSTIIPLTTSTIAQSKFRADSLQTDSVSAPFDYYRVRGIERNEKKPGNTVRKFFHTLLWPPRVLIDGALRTTAFSAVFIDEKRILKKFEDFFYLYQDKFGWFPVLNIVTGSPRGYGISLFYNSSYLTTLVKSEYSNSDVWGLKGEMNYVFFKRRYLWNIKVQARLENDDDFFFYGIGPNPQNDLRSHFLPEATKNGGVYGQKRNQYLMNLGVRTSGNWEFFYTVFYQKRSIHDPAGNGADNFSKIFDTPTLPGTASKSRKIYNEFSFRFDNRENLEIIGSGNRVEGYFGISTGINDDKDRLFRAGFDIAKFIPVLRKNRLIVPRFIFDMVEDLRGRDEIAFVEYPRHPVFRGVSRKKLLRSDKRMLLSSVEYQWPLTYSIGGHLVFDYLTVAPSIDKFTTKNAPWAAGFGIDFHSRLSEIGRVYATYGSEGLFFKLEVGLSTLNRDRSDWK